jgi:hypothetical protein
MDRKRLEQELAEAEAEFDAGGAEGARGRVGQA